ncbi:hypothetical protein M947_08960 [Sulfurimonas hongkongensis]|uniref:Uncharacterized protein n=1 Tax=Sulfurimonas hongkongensis TaxID=1172190 RepID=T0JEY9_9BACT|nr:hypothetical protein [Sulfurimonas hongkongensis]EQB35402.1 hypothetical protein M947_08960 [Sulfurimonas hongkongensis]
MKHTYLSQEVIQEALNLHHITQQEADKLRVKLDSESSIYNMTHK